MTHPTVRPSARLGSQLWVERHHDVDRIDRAVAAAAQCGLGLLRVFLVWPWVEPAPGTWDFVVYDAVFDAAGRHGVGIKATLGAENPPWHRGTPGLVQAAPRHVPFTDDEWAASRAYIRSCVGRYRDHPALRQWILWNEPANYARRPVDRPRPHSSAERRLWHAGLTVDYGADIAALNREWNTGYAAFEEVPFADGVVHHDHTGSVFTAFGPWLADYRLRSNALVRQLRQIHDAVREVDSRTPTCLNPAGLFTNHGSSGFDLAALGGVGDVLGCSVHAPWHLGFARPTLHPALTAVTVNMLAQVADRVELTETQSGPVQYGSPHPRSVPPERLAATYLAALFVGAESVTGWCLNPRENGFEAGDWALLDDAGRPGARGGALQQVARALEEVDRRAGAWHPEDPSVWVLVDEASQAVQLIHAWTSSELPGRLPDDAAQGAGAVAAVVRCTGRAAGVTPVSALPGPGRPSLIVVSHLTALTHATVDHLLRRAAQGATILFDAASGHKDLSGHLQQPWPVGLAERAGLRVVDREVDPAGFDLFLHGAVCGRVPLLRATAEFDEAWEPLDLLCFAAGRPAAWSRSWERGRLIWFAGALGPALVHHPTTEPAMRALVDHILGVDAEGVRPLSPDTLTLRVHGSDGEAVAVLGPGVVERGGHPLVVRIPAGSWWDVWGSRQIVSRRAHPVEIDSPDGIVVLVRSCEEQTRS